MPKLAFYANFAAKVKLAGIPGDILDNIFGYHRFIRSQDCYNMTEIDKITEQLRKFRDERDWAQFHNAKDLALALNIEAGELLELFLWKRAEDADADRIKEELADVLAYAFMLADKYGLNVAQIMQDKLAKNKQKYPVDKAKGSAKKYNEL